jgi:putative endonuclease
VGKLGAASSAPSTHAAGTAGEDRAAAFLAARGWLIRERNFRIRGAEIDIIAEKGDQIAFVEVKAWSSLPSSELEYSIDGRKQGRIARAARYYVSRNRVAASRRLRFDVIYIGGNGEVRHIEGAFSGGID